ncbi:MAG: transcriptional repressor LexA [Eubacteriales bacterium]|nr:transcriptional repressor LexA [Eubacteriales bacterium]
MTELTPKEKRIYEYVENTIENEGYAPTVRDICSALGIKSTSTAHLYLRKLDEKGYIKKYDGKSRAVSLERSKYGDKEKTLRVPLLGKVTAGIPITAVQNYEGYVDFPVSMTRNASSLFALRVYGESMKDAGILDGDIVVVEGRQYADNGEIVVAMIEDEATVKRFFREKDNIRLQPENTSMKPIYSKNVTVLGKVIANFRFY